VLRVGAVAGNEFSIDVIERVVGDNDGPTLEALEIAIRAGLVAEHPDRPRGFRFTHALVRDSLYSKLSRVRRARLHLAVGEAIESVYGANLETHRAELYGHFVAAARAGEDPRKAIESALAAADQARRVFANEQAESYYRSAIELLELRPDVQQRVLACEGLGDMLAVRTKYPSAVQAYRGGLVDLAPSSVDRARIERKIGRAQTRARDVDAAAESFNRAEAALDMADGRDRADAELLEIALDRLTLLYWQSDTAEMGRVIRRIRPLSDRIATPAQRVRMLNSMVVRDGRMRRYRLTSKSVTLARQALQASEMIGNPDSIAYCQFQLAFALLWADHPDRAVEPFERALALATRAGDVMLHARVLAYLGVAASVAA
jgi:tetratricopeptide (TPR) repeat protein